MLARVEQQTLPFIDDGNAKWYSQFARQFGKTKHTRRIWSSNPDSRYLPKLVENLCPHKTLHKNAYSSFIINLLLINILINYN